MKAGPVRPSALDVLIERVRAEAGLVLAAQRRASVVAGVRRALEKTRAGDEREVLAAFQGAGDAVDEIVAELTVGETYFFREPAQLRFLQGEVLPVVVRELDPAEPIRLWSAGCSSGEEAYSLAILAEEMGLGARTRVVGSDLSRRAVARAAEGGYGPWSLRGVDPLLIERYFDAEGSRYSVTPRIRARASFACENLAARFPRLTGRERAVQPGGFHVVLCRNMLMYLEPDARDRVGERLLSALAPGGWLLTGPSDPALSFDGRAEPVAGAGGLAYRRSGPAGCPLSPSGLACSGEGGAASASGPGRQDEAIAGRAAGAEPQRTPFAAAEGEAREASAVSVMAAARAAFGAGDYMRAAELASGIDGAEAAVLRVQAVANGQQASAALDLATRMTRRFPAAAEVRCLHAALLVEAGRLTEALDELRRTLYLDRSLAPARQLLRALRGRAAGVRDARRLTSLAGGRPA